MHSTDVDYLDVVMCWKGISTAQAVELTIWERVFEQCLVPQFESHMRRNIVAELGALRAYVNAGSPTVHASMLTNVADHIAEDELWPCLKQIMPAKHKRLVRIDLPELIHDMIDAFYDDFRAVPTNTRWSFRSGDLPNFVYNYIMTQDYLLRFSDGLYISVDVDIAWETMPVLMIYAAVVSQPPNVKLWRMPFGPKDRNAFVLYFERIFSESGSSSYEHFPEDVVCEVKEYKTKGDTQTVSETIVQAKMVTQFPGHVRYDRVLRHAVKGEVMDIYQVVATPDDYIPQQEEPSTPWVPSYTSTPLSKTRPSKARIPSLHESWNEAFAYFRRQSDKSLDDEADISATSIADASVLSDPDLPAESPRKRKAPLRSTSLDGASTLKPADYDPDTCLKRQKVESFGHLHMLTASTSTEVIELQKKWAAIAQDAFAAMRKQLGPLGQPVNGNDCDVLRHSEDIVRRLREAVGLSSPTAPTVSTTRLPQPQDEDQQKSHNEKGKIVALPPTPPMEQHDSFLLRSPSPICLTSESEESGSISSNSATNASGLGAQQCGHGDSAKRHRHSNELSQDEIQKNYREFEAAAQRRMTDPTPVSDVGDMNFERIFLGDSEAEDLSLGDISGLSEEMSGLDMDEK
ncbi:uncharacterized protein J4E88_005148 [Alternaria novae-zelandiae]|uniref:uncharacterized protein n=1 Tax=Alternaria novae-zelandiae TaxID=430562 RepID=UPI0020C2C853|nr:uncharacterized protein J4E88_005148 [Alternaria novae-zelandiae]KAI4682258.1 hypothetical protein J4E88_005148 [Alternaria novae-zelandiae]